MFSGILDPLWEITPNHVKYQEIKNLLRDAKTQKVTYLEENIPAQLGYKGFLVKENSQDEAILILGPNTIKLQEELLNSMPAGIISESLKGPIAQVIKRGIVLPVSHVVKRDAPHFEGLNKAIWNIEFVRKKNNCYNYANDLVTNTYAQPGRGGGQMYDAINNNAIQQASLRDGLVVVQPGANGAIPNIPQNETRHLVALFVDPGKLPIESTPQTSVVEEWF